MRLRKTLGELSREAIRHPALLFFLLAFAAWFFFRGALVSQVCNSGLCWLYPEDWPSLLGITAESPVLVVGLLCAVLFALPFGRGGLLAALIAIKLGEPVFGITGVFAIFTAASVASIVAVHAIVESFSKTRSFSSVRKRLEFFERALAPSVGKRPVLALVLDNLAGSQWHMSALAVLCRVPREKVWLGLFLGNVAGFVLVLSLSSVPNLDAISIILLIVALTLAVSSPEIIKNLKESVK
ncbi:MAG: hypothetical protein V1717_04045 [Candidatus Micrarchaeota archaeon]